MIGKQIGRYRITGEIGRGGMGIVYRATQVTLNRTVALKMLFPHLATSREYLARFRREAESLARLDHENIVRIFEIEEYGDTHCIIMEHVGGPSLSRILAREGRLGPYRARAIAADLADALRAAHQQGIIHRDIKPDNVLFSLDGRPKLTDFGIARMGDGGQATRTGVMIGTPSYMSPEQASGRPVTAASDLYSLGVLLFEMLSGRVPFLGGDPLSVALKHLREPPPPLLGLVADLPPEVVRVVERTLAKAPADRFASASELRAALLALSLSADERPYVPMIPSVEGSVCPECSLALETDFLTCPRCGLSIRQRCSRCERLFDPLSPECPYCRTPSTPTTPSPSPAARMGESTGSDVAEKPDVAGCGAAETAVSSVSAADRGVPAPSLPRGEEAILLVRRWMRRIRSWMDRPRPGRRPLLKGAAPWVGVCLVLIAVAIGLARMTDRSPAADGWNPAGAVPASSRGAAGLRSLRGGDRARVPLTPEEVDAISRAARDTTSAEETVPPSDRPEASAEGERGDTPARQEPRGDSVSPVTSPTKPTVEEIEDTAASAPVDEEVAWIEMIEGIVERQHLATEAGDLDLLLADVAPELHEQVRRSFREMQESAREIRSDISGVKVAFPGSGLARVEFRTVLTGVRIKDGRSVTIYDGTVVWRLARFGDRWLITQL